MPSADQQPISFEQVAAMPASPPDHRIAYGSAPQQFGHLRLPKGAGPHPTVIFVHGGCYLADYSIAHAGALEQALADSGYAVWSLEYRRVGDPGGGWPGTFQDLARGADHLKTLAVSYALDLRRVVAAGHSAGGNSALWLAARSRIPKASPLWVDQPLSIAGVLALAPAGDFAELHAKKGCGGVMDQLMGGSPASVPDRYRAASPGELLPIGVPQAVIIGGRDQSFNAFGQSYVARARAAGEPHLRVIDVADAGHFDVIAPGTPTWTIVLNALQQLFARR
ncbi:MAG: alpha/beta hydrolase [Vicinamibacterales bacterium]